MLIESILGITSGLVGGITTSIINYKMKQLELEKTKIEGEFKIKEIEAISKATIEEAKINMQRDIIIQEGEIDKTALNVISEAYKQEFSRLSDNSALSKLFDLQGWLKPLGQIIAMIITTIFAFVDVLKALIRPTLTIYQLAASTWLTILAWDMIKQTQQGITYEYAQNIFTRFVDTCLYLTVTIVTWYFIDRRIAKDIKNRQ